MKLSDLRPLLVAKVQQIFGVTDWYLDRPETTSAVTAFLPPLKDFTLVPDGDDLEVRAIQEIYIGYRYDPVDYKDLPIGYLEGSYGTALLKLLGFYSALGIRVSPLSDEVPIAAKESQDGYECYLVYQLQLEIPFDPETTVYSPTVQSIDMSIYRTSLDGASASLVLEVDL